jgi:hypothetical protein
MKKMDNSKQKAKKTDLFFVFFQICTIFVTKLTYTLI